MRLLHLHLIQGGDDPYLGLIGISISVAYFVGILIVIGGVYYFTHRPPIPPIQGEVPLAFTSTTVSTGVEEAELPFREIIQSHIPAGFIVVM